MVSNKSGKVRPQSTPEARAKAVATNKRRRAEKKAAAEAQQTIPFDGIPDRAPKVERGLHKRREKNGNNVVVAKQLLLMAIKLLEES